MTLYQEDPRPAKRVTRSELVAIVLTSFPPLDALGIEQSTFNDIQVALKELRQRAVDEKNLAFLRDVHTLAQEWKNVCDTIQGNMDRAGQKSLLWMPGGPR